MKKKIFNKITSGVLLTVVCAGLVIGSAKGSHAKVTGIVDNYQRIEPNVWQAYDGEYNKFNVGVDGVKYDPVNGEKALKIQEKANVLANICDNKEKLTVLEIVPYSLASQYSAYIPSQEHKNIIKSYGNELFSAYGQGGSVLKLADKSKMPGGADNITTHAITSDLYNSGGLDRANLKANVVANYITPIIVKKSGSGFDVNMPNMFIDDQFMGATESQLYKYYCNPDNVEYIPVCLGELRAQGKSLKDYLQNRSDPIDMIIIAGRGKNYYNIYRNVFFANAKAYASQGKKADIVNFLKTGNNPDQFHSGVFKADGTEYKVSELESQRVWYDSYTVKDGQKYSNDFTWEEAMDVLSYVYAANNRNYNCDRESSDADQQKISTIIQLPDFSSQGGGIMTRNGSTYDTNVAKLWIMLCKSSDQQDSKTPYIVSGQVGNYNSLTEQQKKMVIQSNGNWQLKTLTTYFNQRASRDPNALVAREEFIKIKDVAWPAKSWGNLETIGIFGLNDQEMLLHLRNKSDGSFQLYNGCLNMFQPDDSKDLMYSADRVGLSDDSGPNSYRLDYDGNIGMNDLIGYLFGIDDSDPYMLNQPTASYEKIKINGDPDQIEEVQVSPNGKNYVAYIDSDKLSTEAGIVSFSFDAVGRDPDGNLKNVVLQAYSRDSNKLLQTFNITSGNGYEKRKAITINSSNATLLNALKNNQLYFKLTATKTYQHKVNTNWDGSPIYETRELSVTAYLSIVFQKTWNLD